MLFLISGLCWLLPLQASPLPTEQITQLLQRIQSLPPVATLPMSLFEQRDQRLLLPQSRYPDWQQLPLIALQQLAAFRQHCTGTLEHLPPRTRQFERARCAGQPLSHTWFAQGDPIHPLGGSYASHYLQQHPEQRPLLQPFLHLMELDLPALDTLSEDTLLALVRGNAPVLTARDLWLPLPGQWSGHSLAQLAPLLQEQGLMLTPLSQVPFCANPQGNLCWQSAPPRQDPLLWLPLLLLVALGGALFQWWLSRRRLMHERQWVLQMLTHELRTPITALSTTVELFRYRFDQLPESLHTGFVALTQDIQRLRHLAEASSQYLASTSGQFSRQPLSSLDQWLAGIAAQHQITYQLSQECAPAIPLYWTRLCLDNLLSNARLHGVPPVHLSVEVGRRTLAFRVTDQGILPRYQLAALRRPFHSQTGLGLGLPIVARLAQRLGGRLRLQGPPTTFILEIPYVPSSAAD